MAHPSYKHIQQHYFSFEVQLWSLWAVRPLRVGLHSDQRPRAHKERAMTRQQPSFWNETARGGTNGPFHDMVIWRLSIECAHSQNHCANA